MLSILLMAVVPQASGALMYSNLVAVVIIMFMGLLLRPDQILGPIIIVASNLAFWLPIAHTIDVRLEKIRRRGARRRRRQARDRAR